MKVLFASSYFLSLDPRSCQKQSPYPPLGTLYAATAFLHQGYTVSVFDSMIRPFKEFKPFFIQENPDVFVLYDDEFNYLTKMCLSRMRDAALNLIKLAATQHLPIFVYTSDAMDYPEPFLKAGATAVIQREGEAALQDILLSLKKGLWEKNKYSIPGITFFSGQALYRTLTRELITDLDPLPPPQYELCDIPSYQKIWKKHKRPFSLNISTSRGCVYRCNWCAKPLFGKSYRCHSPQRVASEFIRLKKTYGAESLWITDDIFGLKKGWLTELASLCSSLSIQMPYTCLTRADLLLREHDCQNLKTTGCSQVWIGAESGSQRVLNKMEKGITVEQIRHSRQKAMEHGIKIGYFIQFGYLEETWEDICHTRRLIRETLPEGLGISVSYPLPGTSFYEKVKGQLKKKTHWNHSKDLAMLYYGHYSPFFYRILHAMTHHEWKFYTMLAKKNWKRIIGAPFFLFRFGALKIILDIHRRIGYSLKSQTGV